MITINRVPSEIVYGEDAQYVQVSSDYLYSDEGTAASVVITFNNAYHEGQTLEFVWDDKDITFWASHPVNDSGINMPDDTITTVVNDYTRQCFLALIKNYWLTKDFNVNSYDNIIYIWAKEKGTKYNLAVTSSDVHNTAVCTNGVDPVVNTSLKILMQVVRYFDSSLIEFELIHEEALDVDEEGYAVSDICELIRKEAVPQFNIVPDLVYNLFNYPDACKWLGVRFAEQLDAGNFGGFTDMQFFKVLRGGIDKLSQAMAFRNNANHNEFIPGLNFLSNKPDNLKLNYWQPEKLFFVIPMHGFTFNSTWVYVRWNVKNSIGGVISNGEAHMKDMSPGDYFEFLLTPANLGIDYSDSHVYSIDISVLDQNDTIITNKRNYIVDRDSYYNQKFIWFRNTYGAYDCVVMKGRGLEGADYSRRKVVSKLPIVPLITDSEKQNDRNVEIKNLTLNTGFISLAELEWLRELSLSKEIFILWNGIPVPYICTSTKQPLKHDNNFMYSQDFDFELATDNIHYSENNIYQAAKICHDMILNQNN